MKRATAIALLSLCLGACDDVEPTIPMTAAECDDGYNSGTAVCWEGNVCFIPCDICWMDVVDVTQEQLEICEALTPCMADVVEVHIACLDEAPDPCASELRAC